MPTPERGVEDDVHASNEGLTPEAPAKRARREVSGGVQPLKQTSLFAGMKAPRPKLPNSHLKQTSLFDLMWAPSKLPERPQPTSATTPSEVPVVESDKDPAEEAARHSHVAQAWLPSLGPSWFAALEAELRRPSFDTILKEVAAARVKHGHAILPPENLVFRAFIETPLDAVRVVIVGQDPYHGRSQAMGLSFSVPRGMRPPPSLVNMLKEAGAWPSPHGELTSWTQQGVLLLNTVLTAHEGRANSHKDFGWERVTDAAIRAVSREREGVIFLLWGDARAKAKLIDTNKHQVLCAGHPSPLSYEKHFKGCDHFAKTNDIFAARGQAEITWQLPP